MIRHPEASSFRCRGTRRNGTAEPKLRTAVPIRITVLLAAAAVLLSACVTRQTADEAAPDSGTASASAAVAPGARGTGEPRVITGSDGYGTEYSVSLSYMTGAQAAVVESAMALLGREDLALTGRTFTLDCSGVVLGAYWGAGFDLTPLFNRETGNGVKRIHDIALRGGTLQTGGLSLPQPGDIIIWDDTYDKNGDGEWGDEFTHVGIVVDVQNSGQVTYVHHNYAAGIVLARMNLRYPERHRDESGSGEVNSPMRMRSHRYIRPESWLASHLFRAYARLIPLL